MERWLKGSDVMERWGRNIMELRDCIINDGLKPYDENGEELHFKTTKDFTITRVEVTTTRISERFPNLYPPIRREVSFTYGPNNMFFKLSEIEAFEKQQGIERQDLKERQSTSDRKEVLRQAKAIWEDNPLTRKEMAKTLHKIRPGSMYTTNQIERWLKDDGYGRAPGRPKKGINET